MKRVLKALKNKKGMTLSEVMVGVAIIALVSTMMASGFLAASALIRRGADVGGSGNLAAKYIEMQNTAGGDGVIVTPVSSSITVHGVSIAGKYYRYSRQASSETETVEYIVFVPDAA